MAREGHLDKARAAALESTRGGRVTGVAIGSVTQTRCAPTMPGLVTVHGGHDRLRTYFDASAQRDGRFRGSA
jgi:hypothetical protein